MINGFTQRHLLGSLPLLPQPTAGQMVPIVELLKLLEGTLKPQFILIPFR